MYAQEFKLKKPRFWYLRYDVSTYFVRTRPLFFQSKIFVILAVQSKHKVQLGWSGSTQFKHLCASQVVQKKYFVGFKTHFLQSTSCVNAKQVDYLNGNSTNFLQSTGKKDGKKEQLINLIFFRLAHIKGIIRTKYFLLAGLVFKKKGWLYFVSTTNSWYFMSFLFLFFTSKIYKKCLSFYHVQSKNGRPDFLGTFLTKCNIFTFCTHTLYKKTFLFVVLTSYSNQLYV